MCIASAIVANCCDRHRNVNAVHVSVSAATDGARKHQSAAPVDDTTSTVRNVSIETAGSYPKATIFDAAPQF